MTNPNAIQIKAEQSGAWSAMPAVRVCLSLMLLTIAGRAAPAQEETNSVAASSSSFSTETNSATRSDYESFRIVSERNIFNPNRGSRAGREARPEKQVKTESFALVGTLSYEKGTFAFFDGTSSQYRKAIKTGDDIAGYKVTEIASDRVKLEASGQATELLVGKQMTRRDEGEWQMGDRTGSFVSTKPSVAPETKNTADSGSASEPSEVLKRLMQKREQENK